MRKKWNRKDNREKGHTLESLGLSSLVPAIEAILYSDYRSARKVSGESEKAWRREIHKAEESRYVRWRKKGCLFVNL